MIFRKIPLCKFRLSSFQSWIYLLPTITFSLFHSFSILKTKENLLKEVYLKVSIPKLLNNSLASCPLKKFDFLLWHTAHFDKSIILPFLLFTTFVFLLSLFFLHFEQYDNIVALLSPKDDLLSNLFSFFHFAIFF